MIKIWSVFHTRAGISAMGPAELNTRRYYQTVIRLIALILLIRIVDIMGFKVGNIEIESGLSFDAFKTIVLSHLNSIGFSGDKKEMVMLGWISYAW